MNKKKTFLIKIDYYKTLLATLKINLQSFHFSILTITLIIISNYKRNHEPIQF